MITGSLSLAVAAYFLVGCDQSGSSGHMTGGGMTGGGMMGGGMMGQMSQYDDRTLPEPQSEATQSFRHYCGQCHAPPDPAVHTARDWPKVVARMRQQMVTQGKAVPDREQLKEITAYLQRNAG